MTNNRTGIMPQGISGSFNYEQLMCLTKYKGSKCQIHMPRNMTIIL